jgi:hypothetical protein
MDGEFTHEFFESSSLAWHSNKVRRGPMYYYKCSGRFKTGRPCNRLCLGSVEFCKLHTASSAKPKTAPLAAILTSGASGLADLRARASDNPV